jgi:hypothetical protein
VKRVSLYEIEGWCAAAKFLNIRKRISHCGMTLPSA